MQGDSEQLIHWLSWRYFSVLALVAALLLADQALLQPLLMRLNGLGPVINLAGRQRMLSQRMAKAVLAVSRDPDHAGPWLSELQECLDNWIPVHEGLQVGSADLQLPGTTVPRIRSAFTGLEPHVEAITAAVRTVLQNPADSVQVVDEMLAREKAYLPVMDRIVGMFEQEANSQVRTLRILGIAATVTVLLLMLGLARLVLQPATHVIRNQVNRLSASEERFRLLIERMNDGVAVFTSDGRLRYVNSRFSYILQREPEALIGRPLQNYVSGENLRLLLRMLSHVLPAPETARELSWELPEGGSRVTLAAAGTAQTDSANDGLSFLVVTDITSIKAAERELRVAHDALEQRVTERTCDLVSANAALATEVADRQAAEERNRQLQSELAHASRITSLGQFASGLAHEINQPLGAIANYADALNLMVRQPGIPVESVTDTSARIRDAALRAGRIVGRMRRFLKMKPAQKTPEHVNSLIADVLDLCAPEIRMHRISVETRLTETAGMLVLVDPIQIQQVLVNLIQNAVQAMAACDGPQVLTIRTAARDGHADISVEDTGPGFPFALAGTGLARFRSTKSDGLGLGLSISQALVSAHQGELRIESRDPRGAAVHFSLAIHHESARRKHADSLCRG